MTALLSLPSPKFACCAPTLQDQGKLAEAEPHYQRTLTILEKSLGPEHPNVASTLNNLAQLLQVRLLSNVTALLSLPTLKSACFTGPGQAG